MLFDFGPLRSVVGERGKCSGGREERLASRGRSETSRRRAADGSARDCGLPPNAARDERAGLRSGTGVVEREKGATDCQWSGANRALVTAE